MITHLTFQGSLSWPYSNKNSNTAQFETPQGSPLTSPFHPSNSSLNDYRKTWPPGAQTPLPCQRERKEAHLWVLIASFFLQIKVHILFKFPYFLPSIIFFWFKHPLKDVMFT